MTGFKEIGSLSLHAIIFLLWLLEVSVCLLRLCEPVDIHVRIVMDSPTKRLWSNVQAPQIMVCILAHLSLKKT